MYRIGQQVCLWQTDYNRALQREVVLKEVIVMITDIKTGVPGEFSGRPSGAQSLKGIGNDGQVYEKHWSSWPESQTNCFTDTWSARDDGVDTRTEGAPNPFTFWIPKEAVYVHNRATRHNTKHPDQRVHLVDKDGKDILPKGHVTLCPKHNHYLHPQACCTDCSIEMIENEKAVKTPSDAIVAT